MARNIKASRTRISRRFSQVDRRHHSGGSSSWYQATCLIHVNKANPATILNDTFHVSCFRANRNRSAPPSKYSAARNKAVKQIKGIPTSLESTCIGSRRAANVLVRSMPRFAILHPKLLPKTTPSQCATPSACFVFPSSVAMRTSRPNRLTEFVADGPHAWLTHKSETRTTPLIRWVMQLPEALRAKPEHASTRLWLSLAATSAFCVPAPRR